MQELERFFARMLEEWAANRAKKASTSYGDGDSGILHDDRVGERNSSSNGDSKRRKTDRSA
jgi:hypothetical protein